jgi:uncharacterized protein (DUF2062 family)
MLEQVVWIVITCVATPLSIPPIYWLGYRLQDYLESKRPGWFR